MTEKVTGYMSIQGEKEMEEERWKARRWNEEKWTAEGGLEMEGSVRSEVRLVRSSWLVCFPIPIPVVVGGQRECRRSLTGHSPSRESPQQANMVSRIVQVFF